MLAKLQEAKEVLEARGEIEALRFASKLNCLGEYRDDIQRGYSAYTRPAFYEDCGKDPGKLVEKGLESLRRLLSTE